MPRLHSATEPMESVVRLHQPRPYPTKTPKPLSPEVAAYYAGRGAALVARLITLADLVGRTVNIKGVPGCTFTTGTLVWAGWRDGVQVVRVRLSDGSEHSLRRENVELAAAQPAAPPAAERIA